MISNSIDEHDYTLEEARHTSFRQSFYKLQSIQNQKTQESILAAEQRYRSTLETINDYAPNSVSLPHQMLPIIQRSTASLQKLKKHNKGKLSHEPAQNNGESPRSK